MKPTSDGRSRVVIEGVRPEIDAGLYPIKRIVGERLRVEADIFGDGHDVLDAAVQYRYDDAQSTSASESTWHEVSMQPVSNDRWRAEFTVDREGSFEYTVVAWIDRFLTWHHELQKRVEARQVTSVDLLIGAELIELAAGRATGIDRETLTRWVERLRGPAPADLAERVCDDDELRLLVRQCMDRAHATTYDRTLRVTVDRERAGFSAWYEMFPRSASGVRGRHGTLNDVRERLPYVAAMGFDVLYLPPIHPVGTAFRKGKNNATAAGPEDVGSPWGIGSPEGGHKAIHPELGTREDFRRLVSAAHELGIELALDIAFQCSPDHPYVTEHPEWFRQRPDGTIQYAENPPKKYQDIYPFDFETDDWEALWSELKSVFEYWMDEGVRIFRVDNPHTKPFVFWEWCIAELKRRDPGVLFLAEAFTRPKIMYRLARLGFSQSYTYFAWRNTKAELTEYMTELVRSPVRDFFRPNFWPNTPDILTEYLQDGGEAAFMLRLVLAATLSANYGIYGPPFEHCWNRPREPGSEEYLDSEKYELYHHDLDRPDSLKDFIAQVNRVRREFPLMQSNHTLRFHEIEGDQLICFSKSSDDGAEIILVIANLDPHHLNAGFVNVPLDGFELDDAHPYQVHDLLSDTRFVWQGPRNFVELNPGIVPAHVFHIRRRVRSELDFQYDS